MLPDRVSNPGPPTYESGVLPIALRGPAYALDRPDQYADTTGTRTLPCSRSEQIADTFFLKLTP